jgi:hypothetical protein
MIKTIRKIIKAIIKWDNKNKLSCMRRTKEINYNKEELKFLKKWFLHHIS